MSEVLVEARGHAGVITLDRPKALNALTHDMIRAIDAALDRFEADPAIAHVVIRSASPKAFSAGGDIRALVDWIRAGDFATIDRFYRDEYRLNQRIKRCPKPYVALIDGIVMGGGVGVSFHGARRIASEKLVFAMPEVGIGFFPDVGATFFLPRLPARAGLHLALTGARVGLADAIDLGLATDHVPSAAHEALLLDLADSRETDAIIARHAIPAGTGPLLAGRATLERLYGHPTLAGALAAIADDSSDLAAEIRAILPARSPTSIAIAWRQMIEGLSLDFEGCMRLEYRIVTRLVRGPDFPEGVRALILDKDNLPRWSPARIEDVDLAVVDAHVAPLPGGDLEFDR